MLTTLVFASANVFNGAKHHGPVHNVDDVDELLLVIHGPVDFIVVASAKVNLDLLVAEEEHDGAGVIQLIHVVEVRHFGDIDKVDDSEVLHRLCHS